ncbi:MAG TPA: hypothetical protein VFB32_16840, partial [Rudaea sp.]|nr:hypothetical protein [Rudaea sp.]
MPPETRTDAPTSEPSPRSAEALPLPPAHGHPLRRRLAEKLPEILIEAGSVFLALLLALAASAWHEYREDTERAAQARSAILAELAENRREYARSAAAVSHVLADLQAAVGDEAKTNKMSVDIPLALLSQAAWRTAQTTRAFRDIDYAWMI